MPSQPPPAGPPPGWAPSPPAPANAPTWGAPGPGVTPPPPAGGFTPPPPAGGFGAPPQGGGFGAPPPGGPPPGGFGAPGVPPYGGPPYGATGAYNTGAKRSGMAVASLVLGIIGLIACFLVLPSILAIVFAFVAFGAIKRSPQTVGGKGLATAGLVTGIVGLLVGGAVIAIAVTSDDVQESIEDATATGYEGIDVGDCVSIPDGSVILGLNERPCDEPHEGEVFVVDSLPDGRFPGEDEVSEEVEGRCIDAYEPYVGIDYDSSRYDVYIVYPRKGNWEADDRGYLCMVVQVDDSDLPAGSVRGSGE